LSQPGARRGRAHNAEGAREAILNAAAEIFAEHGFDGARVDAIAAAADYNKGLIFQYFGDKLGLYYEVLKRADDETRDMQMRAIAKLAESNAAPHREEAIPLLKNFMGEMFDFYLEHPQMARIFLWEMAEGWQTYAKIAAQIDISDIDRIRQILSAKELLRSNLDPMIQVVTAQFIPMLFLACIPLFQMFLPGEGLPSPEALIRAREFIVDFIANGLLAGQPEPKERHD
jgi:TetR/AcrR family transcriptional regulator